MALNSTPRRRFGVALGVVLTGVSAGLLGFAGIASAHNGEIEAACKGDKTTLTVHLENYANGANKGKSNHIKITDNGKVVVDESFQVKVDKNVSVSGAVDHAFVVDVTAYDNSKYNKYEERNVKACVTAPPTQTSSSTPVKTTESTTTTTTTQSTKVPPSSETTTTTTTEVAPVVATSTTTPVAAPAAQGGPLAETGASIALPLGIAGFLLVGGAVMLFVVRRRGSKA